MNPDTCLSIGDFAKLLFSGLSLDVANAHVEEDSADLMGAEKQ